MASIDGRIRFVVDSSSIERKKERKIGWCGNILSEVSHRDLLSVIGISNP